MASSFCGRLVRTDTASHYEWMVPRAPRLVRTDTASHYEWMVPRASTHCGRLVRTDTASHYEPPQAYSLCPGCQDDMTGYDICPQMLCQSTGMCRVYPVGTCYTCGSKAVNCNTKHYIYDEDCTVRERVWLCAAHHPTTRDEHTALENEDQEKEDVWQDNNGKEIAHNDEN